MEIVVFGAGSLGSLIGGLCAREHRVTLVGRDPHTEIIHESGLRLTGEFDFTVHPDARTTVPRSADLALVTVKTPDTESAARALEDCNPNYTCSLQNGLGNEEILTTHLDTVLAGTCTYGARLDGPGTVECTGLGEITLGTPDGGPSEPAERVGRAFRAASIETTVTEAMPRQQWKKLAINAGINPTTALARVENGALRDDPLHGIATEAAHETARVAREQGIALTDEEVATALESVINATAGNTSSMLQDVRAGSRTEIGAINGAVVERADSQVPVNRTLTALVRAWERDR
jgi:2-dehydropantoate 2-reductase